MRCVQTVRHLLTRKMRHHRAWCSLGFPDLHICEFSRNMRVDKAVYALLTKIRKPFLHWVADTGVDSLIFSPGGLKKSDHFDLNLASLFDQLWKLSHTGSTILIANSATVRIQGLDLTINERNEERGTTGTYNADLLTRNISRMFSSAFLAWDLCFLRSSCRFLSRRFSTWGICASIPWS